MANNDSLVTDSLRRRVYDVIDRTQQASVVEHLLDVCEYCRGVMEGDATDKVKLKAASERTKAAGQLLPYIFSRCAQEQIVDARVESSHVVIYLPDNGRSDGLYAADDETAEGSLQ